MNRYKGDVTLGIDTREVTGEETSRSKRWRRDNQDVSGQESSVSGVAFSRTC